MTCTRSCATETVRRRRHRQTLLSTIWRLDDCRCPALGVFGPLLFAALILHGQLVFFSPLISLCHVIAITLSIAHALALAGSSSCVEEAEASYKREEELWERKERETGGPELIKQAEGRKRSTGEEPKDGRHKYSRDESTKGRERKNASVCVFLCVCLESAVTAKGAGESVGWIQSSRVAAAAALRSFTSRPSRH